MAVAIARHVHSPIYPLSADAVYTATHPCSRLAPQAPRGCDRSALCALRCCITEAARSHGAGSNKVSTSQHNTPPVSCAGAHRISFLRCCAARLPCAWLRVHTPVFCTAACLLIVCMGMLSLQHHVARDVRPRLRSLARSCASGCGTATCTATLRPPRVRVLHSVACTTQGARAQVRSGACRHARALSVSAVL